MPKPVCQYTPSDLAVEQLWKRIPSAPVQLQNWDAVFFNFANIGAYVPQLLTRRVEGRKEPVFGLLLSLVFAECSFTNVLLERLKVCTVTPHFNDITATFLARNC